MDPRPEDARHDSLVVTGLGHLIAPRAVEPAAACDPLPFLKVKKLRKYMGLQDDLAVIAAGKALESAGLAEQGAANIALGERAGLYLVVGCIPFEQADIDPLLAGSLENESFSMQRFSTTGYKAVNGLLTFRCLPNMPAFHISANFDVQGPYFVTYPGPGQYYLALEEAVWALNTGAIDLALVGGVAHQRNLLVEFHHSRLTPPVPADRLLDAAGCLVLERASHAAARGAIVRGRLVDYEVAYRSHSPFEESRVHAERLEGGSPSPFVTPGELGPALLPAMLSIESSRSRLPGGTSDLPTSRTHPTKLTHHLESRDGILGTSTWELT